MFFIDIQLKILSYKYVGRKSISGNDKDGKKALKMLQANTHRVVGSSNR